MSHGKQFTLYSHIGGPNGWKVSAVLEELGLTYEAIYLNFQKGEHRAPEHTKYNPNGRVPTLIDHKNNEFVIWESNAIMLYLVEKYDTERKLLPNKHSDDTFKLYQWLFFQASGQGPYYGQAAWFTSFHPEKIPSALERYQKEVIRVLGVLETVLSKQEWLVGDKYTIADLSFITWNNALPGLMTGFEGFNFEKDFPAVATWHAKINAREPVKRVLDLRASLMKPQQ